MHKLKYIKRCFGLILEGEGRLVSLWCIIEQQGVIGRLVSLWCISEQQGVIGRLVTELQQCGVGVD